MLFSLIYLSFSKLSCKNTQNANVDWFTAFKVPKIKDSEPNHANGLGFFYTDPSTTLSEAPSNLGATTGNPLYYSLQPVYQKDDDNIGYMMVSDQPPHRESNPSDTYAHKKGVLIYDKDNGIFIEHSVPRYPNDPKNTSTYSYPDTGTTYGQSFLCTTLTHDDIDKWAKGMLIERGYVYTHNTPSFAKTVSSSIPKIINADWNEDDMTLESSISTQKADFILFSKHRKWGKDLYHDLIAPYFKKDVYAETWSRGTGTFTSNCSGSYSAYNVLSVNFLDVEWERTKDHSKWCVVGDYVCIGGINRQQKQTERGGGTWCRKDSTFANKMKKIITEYQSC